MTKSDTKLTSNRTIAVDTTIIPLGPKVRINGKIYVAEDTGSAIKGKIIDLYVPSHKQAIKNGVDYKKVEIFSKNEN